MKTIHILSAAVLLALTVPAGAQNINQSVQVTNDYLTRFADFQKQGGDLQVPDSLLRFDYSFDYSVFDTPYRGSYEFSPYRIDATPAARLSDASRLYLRAGAGYTFHPELQFAWRVLDEKNYKIGLTAGAGGYAGPYRTHGGAAFRGHDLWGRAALDGEYLTDATRWTYGFGYDNVLAGEDTDEPSYRSGFHSVIVSGRAHSRPVAGSSFSYDVDAAYRHSSEIYDPVLNQTTARESSVHGGFSVGTDLQEGIRIYADAALDLDLRRRRDELFNGKYAAFVAAVTPHVEFVLGPVRLDAGLRADFGKLTSAQGSFALAPAVTARFDLPDYGLEIFAAATGGQTLQTHYMLKQMNHFAYRANVKPFVAQEKLHLKAGVAGHWRSALQYEVTAGFVDYASQPLVALGGVNPVDFKSVYLQVRGAWHDARLDVDGGLRVGNCRLPEKANAYAPAAFTADLRGTYNWQKRIYAGAYLQASSARRSMTDKWLDIAGYADFGLLGEYRLDRRWTVWAQAGNLFGMAIERIPGNIEKSPFLTLGFSLKL